MFSNTVLFICNYDLNFVVNLPNPLLLLYLNLEPLNDNIVWETTLGPLPSTTFKFFNLVGTTSISGPSCNCCISRLVEKLTVTTKPHTKPYKNLSRLKIMEV